MQDAIRTEVIQDIAVVFMKGWGTLHACRNMAVFLSSIHESKNVWATFEY